MFGFSREVLHLKSYLRHIDSPRLNNSVPQISPELTVSSTFVSVSAKISGEWIKRNIRTQTSNIAFVSPSLAEHPMK